MDLELANIGDIDDVVEEVEVECDEQDMDLGLLCSPCPMEEDHLSNRADQE
jgi:hypothetical protein